MDLKWKIFPFIKGRDTEVHFYITARSFYETTRMSVVSGIFCRKKYEKLYINNHFCIGIS